MGGAVVAVRRDDRAGRQGPLDRRRVARPERRDRPRGVRARAAAQRPVRVPQHRRQEDVDLQGPRRGRPHDRRGRAAGAAALPVPAAAPEPGDRVRSRRAPTRSRACSTSSTGSPPRRPAARSRASCRRATRRRSATRCSTRTPTSPPRRPPSGRRSRTSRCSSRSRASTSRRGSRPRRASALTERETADPRRTRGRRARLARGLRARARQDRRSTRRAARRGRPSSTTEQRGYPARPWPERRPTATARSAASSGRPRIFAVADGARPAGTPRRFDALYLAFLGRPNGPRAGWLLACLDRGLRRSAGSARPRRRPRPEATA